MRNGIRHAQCTIAWPMLFDRFEIHVQVADLASRNSRSQRRSENGSGISGGWRRGGVRCADTDFSRVATIFYLYL